VKSFDFVIIGAGIMGLTVARAIRKRKWGSVCLLEKEDALGRHASGRNSGVVHAGIYYQPGSLKSQVCVKGAAMLQAYAKDHGIPFRKTGKVIVASHPRQIPVLVRLYERALANGVRVEKIDEKRLKDIEPEARTVDQAIYSPDTGIIDSNKTLSALEREILTMGAELKKSEGARLVNTDHRTVKTRSETVGYGHLVNAAGLQADKIAHACDVGRHFRILPFRGTYHKLRPHAEGLFRGSIYPVPEAGMPFLGVHITKSFDEVYVGPTAMPAMGRENYRFFEGLNVMESGRILKDLFMLMMTNRQGFRSMVASEIKKYRFSYFVQCVRDLAPRLTSQDVIPCQKMGIRAQLYDIKKGELVMDFFVEHGPHSTHILNAVSPGFTSSFAFAEVVCDRMEKTS
jgi:(S)-2-hydroxyglutarate dehydrogenase